MTTEAVLSSQAEMPVLTEQRVLKHVVELFTPETELAQATLLAEAKAAD